MPFSPGGGSDVLTRSMMEYLELPNDQTFVAVNVDGAAGYIGCQQAFNSANDGYTLLAHNPMDVVSYTLGGTTDVSQMCIRDRYCPGVVFSYCLKVLIKLRTLLNPT